MNIRRQDVAYFRSKRTVTPELVSIPESSGRQALHRNKPPEEFASTSDVMEAAHAVKSVVDGMKLTKGVRMELWSMLLDSELDSISPRVQALATERAVRRLLVRSALRTTTQDSRHPTPLPLLPPASSPPHATLQ